ncbi:MAG: hypothetical protein K0S11_1068 [Gammaproteobacteria bacterium]|jgi:hypothetical protein|nr:hypothetical protein [Gammaproteobacteria bacterium]
MKVILKRLLGYPTAAISASSENMLNSPYQELITAIDTAKSTLDKVLAIENLAFYFRERQQYEEAEVQWYRARDLASELPNLTPNNMYFIAHTHYNLINFLRHRNKNDAAKELIGKLVALAHRSHDDTFIAKCIDLQAKISQSPAAADLSYNMAKRAGDISQQIRSLQTSAQLLTKQGNLRDAVTKLEQAYQYAEQTKDRVMQVRILESCAYTLRKQDKVADSLIKLEQAYELAKRHTESENWARVGHNLACELLADARLEQALNVINEIVEVTCPNQVQYRRTQVNILAKQEKWVEALAIIDSMTDIKPADQLSCLFIKVDILKKMRQTAEIINILDRILLLANNDFNHAKDNAALAVENALFMKGDYYLERANYQEASKHYLEAAKLANPKGRLFIMNNVALCQLGLQDPVNAAKTVADTLQQAENQEQDAAIKGLVIGLKQLKMIIEEQTNAENISQQNSIASPQVNEHEQDKLDETLTPRLN